MSSKVERKLAAIMFTDIAGYTALSAKDSLKASELLKTQRDTLKPLVDKHGGSWMKEIGDGLLLTFDSATSAVECAVEIQKITQEMENLNLRIGLHEGEVIKQNDDVVGDDVNIASRIEPFSAIGGIAISHKIQQAISSNKEFETKYIGKPQLRGVSQKIEVYCITSHELPETNISKVSAKLEKESRFNIFTITGGVLTVIGITFWIAVGLFDFSFATKTEAPSIAILMMENLGDKDEEYWSTGMTADLITRVEGSGLVRVSSLNEILNLNKKLNIQDIAKELRVKYILTHNFIIKGNTFELWYKLENAENGIALFSHKIIESMNMTTQIVGRIGKDIVTALKIKTKQNIEKAPTTKAEAYELYLKGKYKHHYIESSSDASKTEDINVSRGLLERAIELDNNLLDAKYMLGRSYWRQSGVENQNKARDIFKELAQQAKELNDPFWSCRCLRNIGNTYYEGDNIDTAFSYYARSLKTCREIGNKEQESHALNNIGNIYIVRGDVSMATKYYNLALDIYRDIDYKYGIHTAYFNLGEAYFDNGDYDKALDYYNKQVILINSFEDKNYDGWKSFALTHMGFIYYWKNNYKTAIKYLDKAALIQIELYRKINLKTLSHLLLSKKKLDIQYDKKEILELIKNNKNEIESNINLALYKLLEDTSYLETAYNQIQKKTEPDINNLKPDDKLLSYPIPKAIIEEYNKVFKKQ